MKERIYTLQLSADDYNYVTAPLSSIKILKGDEFIANLISEFHSKYNAISLPDWHLNLLSELLEKYQLNQFKEEFITIIGFLNYAIKLYTPDIIKSQKQRELFSEFQNEKEEWTKLLDFLYAYLQQNNKGLIEHLAIKAGDDNLKLTNFFVIKDAIDSICSGLGITIESYELRRTEILNDLNSLNFKNVSKFIIRRVLFLIHDFLQQNEKRVNSSMRFIGFLYRLADIKTEKDERIELYPDLQTNLDDINVNNLRLSLKRKTSIDI